MPVPIKIIDDKGDDRGQGNDFRMDYSILSSFTPKKKQTRVALASNKNAEMLFEMWSESKRLEDGTYSIDKNKYSSREIMRLKSAGLITTKESNMELTSRGKMVIVTLALGESNRFERNSKKKSYTEILASVSKQGKQGYRQPKYAANTSNNLDIRDI
jgi:hypothetical protein